MGSETRTWSNKERRVQQRAFVVDVYVPTPDQESGSLRLVNLFALLRELGIAR